MTTTDSQGVVYLEDTDLISPFHTTINTLQSGTSAAIKVARRGPLFAPDLTARNAYLTEFGSSSTNPLWVEVAGVLWRHDGSTWTRPIPEKSTITVDGTMTGSWPGGDTVPDVKFVTKTVSPAPGSGDFIVMTPSEYAGGGILTAHLSSFQTFDLVFGYRMDSGNLIARGYNTSGTAVTNSYGVTGRITYWKP